ncbi:uncharacterized protein N7482_001458 [Penicillium canariense]|uniref:FAD-binding domain-containing protein n=1 Tax=Penicillium canariense TaxID=189055 RepID=A0A9W9LT41_9EURO|nr:uncharacterized protein N7482_001458 [Penicillium canariense]KAJ5175581.1 hypothetical protein N7482_001458 [Penicillium canariense]
MAGKEATKPAFKVIIAGGSIAGLALAHCLYHAGIDFIVLEKRHEIGLQEGASVGIMPNGGRILDQLGLYSGLEDYFHPLEVAYTSYPDGFTFISQYPKLLTQRFGYPLAFLDRQVLLQHLYSSLKCPENVYTNKQVTRVEQSCSYVRVYTKDGECYTGNLLVGADGVHSRVRSEMWRLDSSSCRGMGSESDYRGMEMEYACVFGISSANSKLQAGQQINCYRDGWSILSVVGKHGRTYWFLFLKLDKKYQYQTAPRLSSEDATIHCEKIADEPFYHDVKFGDLWDRREVFNMVPLEEYALTQWHHGNIVCIGDSMHKIAPHTGQGANCAIEDAAALTNRLRRFLQGDGARLRSSDELNYLLQEFTTSRIERLSVIHFSARLVMRLHAREGLLFRLAGRYYLPYAGDIPADKASAGIADAPTLDFIPLPDRTGSGWIDFKRSTRSARPRLVLGFTLLISLLVAVPRIRGWFLLV